MISISAPPPITPTTRSKKVQENSRIAEAEQFHDAPNKPFVDRRKQRDRRRQQRKGQLLESRSGQDRRRSGKTGKGRRIDITA